MAECPMQGSREMRAERHMGNIHPIRTIKTIRPIRMGRVTRATKTTKTIKTIKTIRLRLRDMVNRHISLSPVHTRRLLRRSSPHSKLPRPRCRISRKTSRILLPERKGRGLQRNRAQKAGLCRPFLVSVAVQKGCRPL